MQTLALVIGIIALVVSGAALYQITKVLESLRSLSKSVDEMNKNIEDLEKTLEDHHAQLAQLHKKPAHQGDLMQNLLSLPGNANWQKLAAVGIQLFAAYLKKRKQSPNSSKSKAIGAGNATESKKVK